MSVTPNSARATIAAGAVPPDPDTTAAPVALPSAPVTPSMSVLSARQPRGVRSRVLAGSDQLGPVGALVGEPQRGEFARASSPRPRPTPARTRRPRRAVRRRRTRCAHRSSRPSPAPGRRPDAAAESVNGRSANRGRRLFYRALPDCALRRRACAATLIARCRGHRCAWPTRCSPDAVGSRG